MLNVRLYYASGLEEAFMVPGLVHAIQAHGLLFVLDGGVQHMREVLHKEPNFEVAYVQATVLNVNLGSLPGKSRFDLIESL